MEQVKDVTKWLKKVKDVRPLVHNITNVVVTNVVANSLLAVGASPVMAYAVEEVDEMARTANALALNMGTLDRQLVESMFEAGRAANEAQTPVIFDPVGVGATAYRNDVAAQVTDELDITVLRGNYGEIGFMVGTGGKVKGVDSAGGGEQLPQLMKSWAKARNTVVIATGPIDYVTDGNHVFALHNGNPLLAAITGSGCQATGIIAAFCGVVERGAAPAEYADACIAALTAFNVAGELAAATANGPGSLQAALFDVLFNLDENVLIERARIERMQI